LRIQPSTKNHWIGNKRRIDELRMEIGVNESFKKKLVRSMFMEKEWEMEK